jgi:hypothetical protein
MLHRYRAQAIAAQAVVKTGSGFGQRQAHRFRAAPARIRQAAREFGSASRASKAAWLRRRYG